MVSSDDVEIGLRMACLRAFRGDATNVWTVSIYFSRLTEEKACDFG